MVLLTETLLDADIEIVAELVGDTETEGVILEESDREGVGEGRSSKVITPTKSELY